VIALGSIPFDAIPAVLFASLALVGAGIALIAWATQP